MPWMETNVLEQRSQFVRDFESGHWSMTELCERYGVTRPTGYKWITRHRVSGDAGLANRSRRKWTHPGATPIQTDAPNQVWPADFKGQFKTGDGQYCYPLTVTDHFSRALLVCRGLPSVKTTDAKPVFRALFRSVGLPDAIRT